MFNYQNLRAKWSRYAYSILFQFALQKTDVQIFWQDLQFFSGHAHTPWLKLADRFQRKEQLFVVRLGVGNAAAVRCGETNHKLRVDWEFLFFVNPQYHGLDCTWKHGPYYSILSTSLNFSQVCELVNNFLQNQTMKNKILHQCSFSIFVMTVVLLPMSLAVTNGLEYLFP